MSRLTDVLDALGDIVLSTMNEVRYLNGTQSDTNISRMHMHLFWITALDFLETRSNLNRVGLERGQVREIESALAIAMAEKQIMGLAISLAAAKGWSEDQIKDLLPNYVMNKLHHQLTRSGFDVVDRLVEVKKRKYFT